MSHETKLQKKEFRRYLKQEGLEHTKLLLFRRRNSRNGNDKRTTLGELFEHYKKVHLPLLSESAREQFKKRLTKVLLPIEDLPLCRIEPKTVSALVNFSKQKHNPLNTRKCSFIKELKNLKTMLNWHKQHNDFQFENPVNSYHMRLAVMQQPLERNHKVSIDELKLFLENLSPFYRRFVLAQLHMAARVGEIAGLQKKNVDFSNNKVTIKEVLIWIGSRPKVKSLPKNGQSRTVVMNNCLKKILEEQLEIAPSRSQFVFANRNPNGLRYNSINKAYNKAWKKAGLPYRGTHTIRYAGARLAREMFGTLDHVRAITGHRSTALAAHYSAGDLDKLQRQVSQGFDELGLTA